MAEADRQAERPGQQPDQRPISRSPLKIIAASLGFTIFAQIIHGIFALIGMSYYTDPKYFNVWSPIMMSLGAPSPSMDFFYMSVGFGFIGAMLFVVVYTILGQSLRGSHAKRGRDFGAMIFMVATIPGSLSQLLLLNISVDIVALWTFESLIVYLIGGGIVGNFMAASSKSEAMMKPGSGVKDEDSTPEWMRQKVKQNVQ